MKDAVYFDHVEVHVEDIERYGDFLIQLFRGGRFRKISDSGTSMFLGPDDVRIEVKRRKTDTPPGRAGFCLPCLRMSGARAHIEDGLGQVVDEVVTNPEGEVFFFTDHEGVQWHIKDYVHRVRYINW